MIMGILRVKSRRDGRKEVCKKLNVNEEYVNALRTKSYADFLNKAQLFVERQESIKRFSKVLLEPAQDTISQILESAIVLSEVPELKALMLNYFDVSAGASIICGRLLTNINQILRNYEFIQRAVKSFDGYYSPTDHLIVRSVLLELRAFTDMTNPFSMSENPDFKVLNDEYSSIYRRLSSKRKKVARKKKKNNVLGFWRNGRQFLRQLMEQLDVAARGTYILNRDFDTMSRLVGRLHDEVEDRRGLIRACLERREIRFCMHVVKELKKSNDGFRKQVDELEEHVCLCLLTINRARALVIKEIKMGSCDHGHENT